MNHGVTPWCYREGVTDGIGAVKAGTGSRAGIPAPGPARPAKSAPDFTLPAVNVTKVLPDKKGTKALSLKEVKGKNIVLFFFPKAMSRG